MTLKLVVNNVSNNNTNQTCRSHCLLYDTLSGNCGVYDGIDLDDSKTTLRCLDFTDKNSIKPEPEPVPKRKLIFTRIEDDFDVQLTEEEFLFEFMGVKTPETSNYPYEPDNDLSREDAYWYVSPDLTYGCWIINHSKQKLIAITKGNVVQGWLPTIYKSPIPLHNHNASPGLCSKMAWYVDQEGMGQYVLLVNNQIKMITMPKPKEWNRN